VRWLYLALFLSLSLHLLLLWLMSGKLWIAPPAETVDIEFLERPEGNPEARSRTPRRSARRGKTAGNSLRSLSPRFDLKSAVAAGEAARTADARGTSEWQEEHWGVRGGSLKEMEHFVHYDQLMREIQGLLYYPNALGVRKISGTIHVRLYFTKDSKCDRRRTRAEGHHHYLKFFVLALIQKLCGFETIEHMGFKENQFVDLSFAFVLAEREDRLDSEKRDAINGNVMRFERIAHDVWYEYRIGPIRGIYGIPYWTLDFPWVLDKWESWVEGRDPLDAFRE
jgi:hypothetical protein